MINVEIRNKEKKSDHLYVVVNDIEDLNSYYYHRNVGTRVYLYNKDVIQILTSHSFKEVGEHFSLMSFTYNVPWWVSSIKIEVYSDKSGHDKFPVILINLQLEEWEHWVKPWSLASVARQFEINLAKQANKSTTY